MSNDSHKYIKILLNPKYLNRAGRRGAADLGILLADHSLLIDRGGKTGGELRAHGNVGSDGITANQKGSGVSSKITNLLWLLPREKQENIRQKSEKTPKNMD